jgi:hypothetical protein
VKRSRRCALLVLALAACEVRENIGSTPDGGDANQTWVSLRLADASSAADILFMIDNSPSMAPAQETLRAQLANLIQILDTFAKDGSPGSYHIGVVTSDLGAGQFNIGGGQCRPGGDGGKLQAVGAGASPDCLSPVDANYLIYDQVGNTSNTPPSQDLVTTLGCMVSVGDKGCGFEHQLESVYRALHDPPPENTGFLRPDAVLVIVFLTNEDDCSAPPDTDLFDPARVADYGALLSYRCTQFGVQCGNPAVPPPYGDSLGPLTGCAAAPNPPGKLFDVSRYIQLFRTPAAAGGVKVNPADVVLFAIDAPSEPFQVLAANPDSLPPSPYIRCAGPIDGKTCAVVLDHSCGPPEEAIYGDPAVRLNAVVGTPVLGTSICDSTYGPALTALGNTIVSYRQGNGCLPGVLSDPNDPVCKVSDLSSLPDGTTLTQNIPSCAASDGTQPCWRLEPTASCAHYVDKRDGTISAQRLTIDRPTPVSPNTVTQARCIVLTH